MNFRFGAHTTKMAASGEGNWESLSITCIQLSILVSHSIELAGRSCVQHDASSNFSMATKSVGKCDDTGQLYHSTLFDYTQVY